MLTLNWTNGKIKVLVGSYIKKKFKSEKSFVIDIPEGDFWNRRDKEKIIAILKEELMNNNVREKDLYVTLETKDFFLRIMEFPSIPIKELRENIIYELEDLYSFREDSMDLSFTILSSNKEKIKILVSTFPRVIIDSWKELSEKLKLNLKYIEVSSLSALRGLIVENYDFSKNQVVLFLGNEITDIYVFQEGKLINLYNLSIGTSDLLYETSLVNTALVSWSDEIKTYLSNLPFNIEKLLIIGEEEKSIPLLNYIQDIFSDFPVIINKNLWLSNIGVSLSSFNFPPIPNLNILGKEKILPFEKDIFIRSLLAGILALIIVTSANFYITFQINSLKKERIFLEQNLNQRRAEVEELRKTVEERITLNKGLENWVKELNENKFISPSYFLKDLGSITPVKVWLSNLEVSNENKILLEGYSLDSEGVADFLISLSYSNIFKDVNLQSSNLMNIGNKEVQAFKIVGVIK
ncbi:MAG: PilN domain-containing protein [Dictyoglomaceae bacterium]